MMTISNGLHFVTISLCNARAKIAHSKWRGNGEVAGEDTCFDVTMACTFDVLLGILLSVS